MDNDTVVGINTTITISHGLVVVVTSGKGGLPGTQSTTTAETKRETFLVEGGGLSLDSVSLVRRPVPFRVQRLRPRVLPQKLNVTTYLSSVTLLIL